MIGPVILMNPDGSLIHDIMIGIPHFALLNTSLENSLLHLDPTLRWLVDPDPDPGHVSFHIRSE